MRSMRSSQYAKNLLRNWEGLSHSVYPDVGNKLTIGIGHKLTTDELHSGILDILGNEVAWGDGITDQQCWDLLTQDLTKTENDITALVKVPLRQTQFDALALFAYNIGDTAFENSTLLKLLNEGNYDEVPAQLALWNHVDHKVVAGLTARREAESELWNS